jgi:hypothetical protein
MGSAGGKDDPNYVLYTHGALLGMTFEQIERIRLFVGGSRKKLVLAASNARFNGYNNLALEQENEIAFADLILKDLAQEGDQNALQIQGTRSLL